MKILVTGGAGFIGRYLVKNLIKKNAVTIYDNLSNSSRSSISLLVKKGVKFVKGDILDYELLLQTSKNFDVVIHLAAKSDVSESVINPKETILVNVDGTINLLKCCVNNKIKKIIFASSAAVYGKCKKLPITEKSTTVPLSPYGASKLAAEKKIVEYAKKFGFDAIILRMFNVYGKGQNIQYAGVISKFLKNIKENKPLIIYGDGKQTRDFISINDIVRAFECTLLVKGIKKYNIASGRSVSINNLAEMLSHGKKLKKIHKKIKKGDIKDSIVDVSLAKKELEFLAKNDLQVELSKL